MIRRYCLNIFITAFILCLIYVCSINCVLADPNTLLHIPAVLAPNYTFYAIDTFSLLISFSPELLPIITYYCSRLLPAQRMRCARDIIYSTAPIPNYASLLLSAAYIFFRSPIMTLRIYLSLLLNYCLIYSIAACNYHIMFILIINFNIVTLIISPLLFRLRQIRIYYVVLSCSDNMHCFKMFLNIIVLFAFQYFTLTDVNVSTLLHFYISYWPCAFYVNLFVSIRLLVCFYDG